MRERRIVLVGLVVAAVLLGGCAGLLGTPVPDVKGMTPDQAADALKTAGFVAGTVTYDAEAVGAPGAVIAQTPSAGTKTDKGTPVTLKVAGPQPVIVPSIVGQTQANASTALQAAGLSLGDPITQSSATVAAGTVMQQEPVAGTQVPAGTAIGVVVSKGPEKTTPPASTAKVKVPSLKGVKLATAKTRLNNAGLKWKHVLGDGDGMTAEGFVYKQSPAGGTSVAKGSTVTIYTWEGP